MWTCLGSEGEEQQNNQIEGKASVTGDFGGRLALGRLSMCLENPLWYRYTREEKRWMKAKVLQLMQNPYQIYPTWNKWIAHK